MQDLVKLIAVHTNGTITEYSSVSELLQRQSFRPLVADQPQEIKIRAKLIIKQVVEIKKLLREGKYPVSKIASLYNVSRVCISHIKNGHRWKNVK